MLRSSIQILILITIGLFWSANGFSAPLPVEEITIKEAQDFPEKHLNKKIIIKGTLRFTPDQHYVLEDAEGNRVFVLPFAPFEIPPPRPGTEEIAKKGPKIMGYYVDKPLLIRGDIRSNPPGNRPMDIILNVPDKHFLEVESAQEQ